MKAWCYRLRVGRIETQSCGRGWLQGWFTHSFSKQVFTDTPFNLQVSWHDGRWHEMNKSQLQDLFWCRNRFKERRHIVWAGYHLQGEQSAINEWGHLVLHESHLCFHFTASLLQPPETFFLKDLLTLSPALQIASVFYMGRVTFLEEQLGESR